MIALPAVNEITRPYRGLSVQEVDFDLTEAAITHYLAGREVYRRTSFLALRRKDRTALVAVVKESSAPLFSPVVELRVLALPERVAFIESPDTDVGNATALATAAQAHHRAGVLAYVVQGRYQHINFIWDPRPIPVRLTEVVPPWPPKLFAMAQQAIAFDEELPPIELQLDAVDITELAQRNPASDYLLPCRGAGTEIAGRVSFLDTRPADRLNWLMIGCTRSLEFHRHFYDDEPDRIDICPAATARGPGELTLAKCCLIERGTRFEPGAAVVPWGSNLDEVREALRYLTGVPPVSNLQAGSDDEHQRA
ncbi:hypothetical protein Mycch_5965 (plasmid) [Mycolicibacterium chubuense NBB4]|uniref:Uncharacterized protein n=1 Tax=Mycolicibacterium chubuense (strain NBB4) TaxID=710421 RepID=I4BTG2_MYCCN|nr:hypothetical protein [Mycolicibacterium chubuense]AFM20569.1 hypothetical protein Mycch_5965 [Mycolicibacterium chubuense NBB4]